MLRVTFVIVALVMCCVSACQEVESLCTISIFSERVVQCFVQDDTEAKVWACMNHVVESCCVREPSDSMFIERILRCLNPAASQEEVVACVEQPILEHVDLGNAEESRQVFNWMLSRYFDLLVMDYYDHVANGTATIVNLPRLF